MRTAKATYIAPEGDNAAVTTGGVRFLDGHAVDLNTDDHGRLIGKLQGNPHFEVEVSETEQPSTKRPVGRPPKAKIEAKEPDAKDAPKEPATPERRHK